MTKELIQKFLKEVPAHPVPKTKMCMYDARKKILYMPDGTQRSTEKTTKLQNDLAADGYQIRDTWGLTQNDHPFSCMGRIMENTFDIHEFCGKTIIEFSFFRYCVTNQKWLRTTYRGEQPRYLIVAEDKEIWYNDTFLEPQQRYNGIILPESSTWYGKVENLFYNVAYNDFRAIFFRCTDKEFKSRFGCEYVVDLLDKKYQEV